MKIVKLFSLIIMTGIVLNSPAFAQKREIKRQPLKRSFSTLVNNTLTVEFLVMSSGASRAGISKIEFNGTRSSGFKLESGPQFSPGGDSASVRISFTPKEAGQFNDTLNVYVGKTNPRLSRFALHGASVLPGQERVSSGSPPSLSNSMEPAAAGYKLYPNPVSRVLYLEQPALQKAQGEMQMNVTDLAGRVLYQGPFKSSLVVEDWPKGAYILSIRSGREVQRLKFLKE